jgi:iron(III) transport system substrate-binding protein
MDSNDAHGVSFRPAIRRREFIRLSGLAGVAALAVACGPSATVPAPTQPPSPKAETAPKQDAPIAQKAPVLPAGATAEWDKVVEAANKEGKVSVTTLSGDGYRKVLDKFQAAYPAIEVEQKSAASASFLAPPILQEQAGGIFSYDVALLSPGGPIMGSMMPAGAFDDIRPAIIDPNVKNDAAWIGGLDAGFMDKAKQKVLGITWDQVQSLFYNTDLVKDKPRSIKEMADPKWKGQLTFMEYQVGATYLIAVNMNHHMREEATDYIRKIFVDQQPVFVKDVRQSTEALVRGQAAFASGAMGPILEQFAAEGLAKNVAPLDVPEMKSVNMYAMLLYTKAPHPNAARVIINWLGSRDGGVAVTEHLRFNSRRSDVPPFDMAVHPGMDFEKAKREYLFGNIEDSLPLQQQAQEQLKSLISA